MTRDDLRQLLESFRAGGTPVEEAMDKIAALPFQTLLSAHVDTHRELRTGFPEVIFGKGKTRDEILAIADRLLSHHGRVLVTRLDPEHGRALLEQYPEARYLPRSGIFHFDRKGTPITGGKVVVISAGTSDEPVAEEAVVTAEACGRAVEKVYDSGVAGLHRLLAADERIRGAAVKIVVAGMEGALPSVVAGIYGGPVIAVPTSIGYGVSQGGYAALLAMLASCAPGVSVVNIDNGFGAGLIAAQIAAR